MAISEDFTVQTQLQGLGAEAGLVMVDDMYFFTIVQVKAVLQGPEWVVGGIDE